LRRAWRFSLMARMKAAALGKALCFAASICMTGTINVEIEMDLVGSD
jgi:hypothetical protein